MDKVILVKDVDSRQAILDLLRAQGMPVEEGHSCEIAVSPRQETDCPICRAGSELVRVLERAVAGANQKRSLYRLAVRAVEKPLIERALARTGGNQLAAARLLGIHRNTLRMKIRKLGIAPYSFSDYIDNDHPCKLHESPRQGEPGDETR